jgi:hypothetical protein
MAPKSQAESLTYVRIFLAGIICPSPLPHWTPPDRPGIGATRRLTVNFRKSSASSPGECRTIPPAGPVGDGPESGRRRKRASSANPMERLLAPSRAPSHRGARSLTTGHSPRFPWKSGPDDGRIPAPPLWMGASAFEGPDRSSPVPGQPALPARSPVDVPDH